ncbi:biliverdin-producing heme oxygenase [Massilia forsythiae]|uniref:Biliverdin-producing heme oxygenase n=1 Tax=Massilia forsythiae TaxID=2728020 RepID=A0A7Z2VX18_9BURK|nr:biliverdin-producing heme oxygenase [Massilia forsythiae]QJE00962.1 biliverdin-producing heme oxygenase [Massilia forsythiae]
MNRSNETPIAQAPDPVAALRAATDGRHQQLDSGLPIGAPDASLRDYALHLRMLRAWLLPLQAWLADAGGEGDDGDAAVQDAGLAGHLALIDTDLGEPGMPGTPEFDPHAVAVSWPAQASAAYRWGVRYVIEGSQLGGVVLYKRLAQRLAPHPLRYLKGGDAGPGPRWREFMGALRRHVGTPEQVAEACAGACAAFDAILALRMHEHR